MRCCGWLLGPRMAAKARALGNECDWRKIMLPCIGVPGSLVRRPDPFLYSQSFLMSMGLPVTWDNPDIALFKAGVEQYSYDLTPSTAYDVQIRVHNSSSKFAAAGTTVKVEWLEFGIGGPIRHTVPPLLVANVPPLGEPGEPIDVWTSWTTPGAPGHYCLAVTLAHPNDGNSANNEGWNNTIVRDCRAGEKVQFAVPVWNRFAGHYRDKEVSIEARRVHLKLDGYIFKAPPHAAHVSKVDLEALFRRTPPLWPANTPNRVIEIGESAEPKEVPIEIIVPNSAKTGEEGILNLSATVRGKALGGITLRLRVMG